MVRTIRPGWLWLAGTILLGIAVATIAAAIAGHRARATLADTVLADARLRASLLDSEIARYELVPLALSDDRDVAAALTGQQSASRVLDRKLETLARSMGAAVLYVVDRTGTAIAASNWNTPQSFVGSNYRQRRYVREAMERGSATQYALGSVSRRPGLYLSRRTSSGGVVVIKLEFDRIERYWARAGGDTFVQDGRGIVVVTSRPGWRFASTAHLTPSQIDAVMDDGNLTPAMIRPFRLRGDRVSRTVPTAHAGWKLTLSRSSASLVWAAQRAAAIGAGMAVLALAAVAWGLRQRTLLGRQRTAELEEAVAARTTELTREMEERAATEARAAELREGLRQANRLATLGQVTASVAHETAQPVAAIRTYASSSISLLDRGDNETVRANLAAIERLTQRIGAITGELRGFARRRTDPQRPVALAEIIEGALLILKEQLRHVLVEQPQVEADLMVSGGRTRLEQVLVNLLQNALEAIRGQPEPRIVIDLHTAGDRVFLGIQDNGSGVSPEVAQRLFTPFVTSRPDGLGLGLIISHDIMVEFGGTLQHVPTERGARFEIEMIRA